MNWVKMAENSVGMDNEGCRLLFEKHRWPNGPTCPFCGATKPYTLLVERQGYKCSAKDCRKKYSLTVKTPLENTGISINNWFNGILLVKHNPAISSCELSRQLGITQSSAWHMRLELRELIATSDCTQVSDGIYWVNKPNIFRNIEVLANQAGYKWSHYANDIDDKNLLHERKQLVQWLKNGENARECNWDCLYALQENIYATRMMCQFSKIEEEYDNPVP